MRRYVIYEAASLEQRACSGLDAQRRDIDLFLASFAPQPWQVIGQFRDALAPVGCNGPQLEAALDLVRRTSGAELLVANLDIIDHGEGFIESLLQDPKVRLRAARPSRSDPAQLRVFGAIADHGGRGRTAPPALRPLDTSADGTGPVNSREPGPPRHPGKLAGKPRAASRDEVLITSLRDQGLSYRAIARHLNVSGFRTSRGGLWVGPQVQRVLRRAQARGTPKEIADASAVSIPVTDAETRTTSLGAASKP